MHNLQTYKGNTMQKCKKAIIGGTGVGSLANLIGPFPVETTYGIVETYRFFHLQEKRFFSFPDTEKNILPHPMPSTSGHR